MTKKEIYRLLNESINVYVENGRYYAGVYNTDSARIALAKAEGLQNFIITIKNWRFKK